MTILGRLDELEREARRLFPGNDSVAIAHDHLRALIDVARAAQEAELDFTFGGEEIIAALTPLLAEEGGER